jgi:DNA-binding MarR family transcriptional regulator
MSATTQPEANAGGGTPGRCVCFSLRKTARAVSQLYDECLRPSGLRVTQFSLLAMLARGGEMTLGDLAAALVMDRTTLTRNLQLVEREGWIRIAPGRDRRQRLISITAAGRRRWQAAIPHWRAAQEHMLKGLGTRSWPRLQDDLDAATEAAQQLTRP